MMKTLCSNAGCRKSERTDGMQTRSGRSVAGRFLSQRLLLIGHGKRGASLAVVTLGDMDRACLRSLMGSLSFLPQFMDKRALNVDIFEVCAAYGGGIPGTGGWWPTRSASAAWVTLAIMRSWPAGCRWPCSSNRPGCSPRSAILGESSPTSADKRIPDLNEPKKKIQRGNFLAFALIFVLAVVSR